MFKLKRLYLRNYQSFEEVNIPFDQSGLIVISGFNNKGGDSNGSGKSALISGLTWTLFGRSPNGDRTKDVIRWGATTLTGIIELEQNGKLYKIVRTTDSLDFSIDGEKIVGLKKDVQDIVNQALGTDYGLFLTFNVFTKDWQRFITEVGDADKKKLFKSILNLKRLDIALDKAKEIVASLKATANKTEGSIQNIERAIPDLEATLNKQLELAKSDQEKRQASIKKLLAEKEQLRVQDIDFTGEFAACQTSINFLKEQKLDEKVEFLSIQLNNINNTLFHNQQTKDELTNKLSDFNSLISPDCPFCGQKILPRSKVSHRKHLEIMIKEYSNAIKELEDEKNRLVSSIHEINQKQQELNRVEQVSKQLESKIQSHKYEKEQYLNFCRIADGAIEKLQAGGEDYASMIAMSAERIDILKRKLQQEQELFTNLLKEIDVYSYIVWLYSRQGVISSIIEKCFNRLKFLANKYLVHICSEGFKLDITPFKVLKSGDMQEEIDIFIQDGSRKKPYRSLSAGQQQRINIAFLLALYSWGREINANPFDFILLDEVLDLSLGIKGQEDVINFIYQIKSMINHIIIISHKEVMQDQFDREIKVIRGMDGISRV